MAKTRDISPEIKRCAIIVQSRQGCSIFLTFDFILIYFFYFLNPDGRSWPFAIILVGFGCWFRARLQSAVRRFCFRFVEILRAKKILKTSKLKTRNHNCRLTNARGRLCASCGVAEKRPAQHPNSRGSVGEPGRRRSTVHAACYEGFSPIDFF